MNALSNLTVASIALVLLFIFASGVTGAETSEMSKSPAAQVIDKPFYQAVENSHNLADRLRGQIFGFSILSREMYSIWQKVAEANGPRFPFILIFQINFVILSGLVLELFCRKKLRGIYGQINARSTGAFLNNLWYKGLALLFEILLLLVFIVTSFICYILIFPEKGIVATIASNYLLAAYYIRVLLFLCTVFIEPKYPKLRILPFSDKVTRLLFYWTCSICAVEIFLVRSSIIMKKFNVDDRALLAIAGLIIFSTAALLTAMIMQSRQRVAHALCQEREKQGRTLLIYQIARTWHLIALAFLLGIICIWEIRVLGVGGIHFGKIIIGLLAVPFFFAFDVWGHKLLQVVLHKTESDPEGRKSLLQRMGITEHTNHIQNIYRVLLMAMLVFFILGLFRIDVAIGRMFTAGVLTSIFIVILLYLTWQFFIGWVDKKIHKEMPSDDEEADEGGQRRIQTDWKIEIPGSSPDG